MNSGFRRSVAKMKSRMTDSPAAKFPILLITRNFPPLLGGMERLNQHMLIELAHTYKTGLVGPKGARANTAASGYIWECPFMPIHKFLICTIFKAICAARQLRPIIVIAGSGLTAPIAWLVSRLFGARCIVYLHGLDIEVKHPVYGLFWRPFFHRFDGVVVNSRFTRQLALRAGVNPARIHILHPGVKLPLMQDRQHHRTAFRRRHDLGDVPIMLYVGRITSRKGLSIFAEHIMPRVARQLPTAKLVIIGDNPSLALLRQHDECRFVKDALAANSLRNRALFIGWIDDNELLSAAYFAADVLIFPVQRRPHDNEGFGMVAVEAAAHGLPTVAFSAGGVPDAVADGISGRLIPAGDNAAFARAVIEVLSEASASMRHASCRSFAEKFSWASFGQSIRRICQDVVKAP